MSDAPILVWFRQDLRLTDNPALEAAAASGRPVIPLFILHGASDGRPCGGAGLWWLDQSLAALGKALGTLGSRLVLLRGDPAALIPRLAAETGAGAVVWNRLYGGDAVMRDAALKAALRHKGLDARSFNAGLLIEPWALRTGSGGPYRMFTPFWRAARAAIAAPGIVRAPARLAPPPAWPTSEILADWRLHPSAPDWSAGFGDWRPGEAGAEARLADFLERGLGAYADHRDEPGMEATSRLSPHLHWGEIGPRQVWAAAHAAAGAGLGSERSLDKLMAELGWREFNHHLLFERPAMAGQPLKAAFAAMPWRQDAGDLEAWTRGRTGYPIVDAGMRQLWATGWMHNRVRMVVASFLVKHLLIDWRKGEAWFWDTLVDACEASNPGNWQWVAGCGADAAPFFRIFNPVVQGERFDADGAYVRRWVPELARLPAAVIHRPWTASAGVLQDAGLVLGRDYPTPIVDHAFARTRALAAFKGLGAV